MEAAAEEPSSSSSSSSIREHEELFCFVESSLTAVENANLETLRHIVQKLARDASDEEFSSAVRNVERLLRRLNSQQLAFFKEAMKLCIKWRDSFPLFDKQSIRDRMEQVLKPLKMTTNMSDEQAIDIQRLLEFFASFCGYLQTTSPSPRGERVVTASVQGPGTHDYVAENKDSESRINDKNWSESWKLAVKGVLQKQRRERIRDKSLRSMQTLRKVVAKSDASRERLRGILSSTFLFGDLDPALKEEIIDAFTDVRVSAGTSIIRQGDVGDNFYVIDVGEFVVLIKKGREVPVVVTCKGPGDYFGELALMYDSRRNATVKATTNALVWAVERTTFKSIMSRHLAGSPTAQVLREAPALKKVSTRDLVALSSQSKVQSFRRGQHILRAGAIMDTVCIIQEGQARINWGENVFQGKSNSTRAVSGENVAVMNRLEVLGEVLLLNDETVNQWNYVASSDHTTIIVIERALFTKELLADIRKDLQVQFVSLGLQRLPAFLELSLEQLYSLSEGFEESVHGAGDEITKCGEVLGPEAKIYIVQSGSVTLSKSSDDGIVTTPRGTHTSFTSTSNARPSMSQKETATGFWGSRFGSFLKAGSSPQTPRQSNILAGSLSTQDLINMSQGLGSGRVKKGGSPRQSIGYISNSPWCITTYGVFGDECLLTRVKAKDDDYWPPYKTSSTVESSVAVCLSISIAKLTSILGPIQEVLTRLTNLKILRKIPCLEYLSGSEIDTLSHSLGVRKLHPAETLYRAGDPGDRLYIVSKGNIVETVHTATPDASKQKGDQIVYPKGAYFGETALLTDEARPSTMVAGSLDVHGPGGAELFYLDRGVLEAIMGPLQELTENRKKENEMKGVVKNISFEDLEELGVLGTGLFGKVKLVFCRRTRDFYALKCISKAKHLGAAPRLPSDKYEPEFFFRIQVVRLQEEEHLKNEKVFMSEMDHPFITRLVRTYKDRKNIYLLQELTTGGELFSYMEKAGRLKESDAAFYTGAVLLALEYMHGRGIVYRDLKPENTLIAENGYPKLIDMGFAKRIYNRRTYSMCGTPDYMAPEIIRRQGHGKSVDYWALGCLIYELITNTSAFNRGDDPPQLVFQRTIDGRVKYPPYVSPDAVDLIRKLLDPNPETRLGCRKRGTADIKEHPFFKCVNFQLLARQKEDPPMIPPKLENYKSLCTPVDNFMDATDDVSLDPEETKAWDNIF